VPCVRCALLVSSVRVLEAVNKAGKREAGACELCLGHMAGGLFQPVRRACVSGWQHASEQDVVCMREEQGSARGAVALAFASAAAASPFSWRHLGTAYALSKAGNSAFC
jgi:hypothetical protein